MADQIGATSTRAPWDPTQGLYKQLIDALQGSNNFYQGSGGQGAGQYGYDILNGVPNSSMSGIPQATAPKNPLLDRMLAGMGGAANYAGGQVQPAIDNQNMYRDKSTADYNNYLSPDSAFNKDLMAGNYGNLGAAGSAYQQALAMLNGQGGFMSGNAGGNYSASGPGVDMKQFTMDQGTIDKAIRAAANPIYDQLNQTTMPGLNSAAAASGRYGSNAMATQGALAEMAANRAAGDVGSNLQYKAMLDNAQLKAQAMMNANSTSAQMASAAMAANASTRNAAMQANLQAARELMGYGGGLIDRQDKRAQDSYDRYKTGAGIASGDISQMGQMYGNLLPLGQAYKSDTASANDTNRQNFVDKLNMPLAYQQLMASLASTLGGQGGTSTITPQTYNPSTAQQAMSILPLLASMFPNGI